MRLPQILLLTAALGLASCGMVRNSKLNPANWFGKSQEVTVAAEPTENLDAKGRSLIQNVLSMKVEPYQGGAIVRATGLPPTQGWWQADLVPLPLTENGGWLVNLRVSPPVKPWPQGTQPSREITVALALSDIKLANVREIVVQGAENARSSRR